MLDIFNRKKLAALQAELAEANESRDWWRKLATTTEMTAETLSAQNITLSENVLALNAQLTAIKEKQRENSRKGALAANAKRRAAKEGGNA